MRMILMAAMLAIGPAAMAQNTVLKQKPPVLAPPGSTSGRPGGVLPLNAKALTVRYPDQTGYEVILEATPASNFTCSVDASGSYADKICVTKTPFQSVTLRAGYRKANTSPVPILSRQLIKDKQWEGACAGTVGEECKLDMTTAKTVQINFNGGQLGGVVGAAVSSKE